MKGRPPRRGAVASLAALSVLILFGVSDLAGAAARDSGPAAARERVHAALAALCRAGDRSDTGGAGTPDDTGDAGAPEDAGEAGAGTLSPDGAVELSREPLRARGGHPVGVRRSLMLPDGARLWIDRIEPGGTLRRVVVRYAEPDRSGARPVLLAVAGGDCRITAGRRLTYYEDGMARAVEHLGSDLERVTRTEPLNPPVPGGVERGVVRVALVDSGVNYLLPEIRSRLARGEDGGLVGFDFWDLDARPFDAHPARSAFHPRRHGTRTASLLLAEAPVAALVPYRYPRNDMSRMRRLVEDAAAAGVRIVNLSMGSRRLAEWSDFEAAARDHPEMLFVVSAGNEGLDIDETPVYPASLTLDNLLAVTSADDSGRPARGSNRGRESVDVAVPAERVPVTGFDGRLRRASGSSYAAARVSALAACLLAAHPEWSAAALKSAILARAGKAALPAPDYTGAGLIRDPAGAGRGACPARPDTLSALPLDSWTPETPRPEGAAPAHSHALALDVVILGGAGWEVPEVRRALGRAAAILAQCGAAVARARLRMVEAPRRFRHLDDAWSAQLVERLDPERPAVFFVEDTLREPAFAAEAFGRSNTRRRPAMRDSVWITRAAEHPGVVLAHELFHVLADLGRHEPDPGNLMHARSEGRNTRLSDRQCERLRSVAAASGLAAPVR